MANGPTFWLNCECAIPLRNDENQHRYGVYDSWLVSYLSQEFNCVILTASFGRDDVDVIAMHSSCFDTEVRNNDIPSQKIVKRFNEDDARVKIKHYHAFPMMKGNNVNVIHYENGYNMFVDSAMLMPIERGKFTELCKHTETGDLFVCPKIRGV